MSSSNLTSLISVKEADYGVTPPLSGVTAKQLRYTSEALTGTPTTTESTEIRDDRMSSGQVVVGSEIGGDTNHELAKDGTYDEFFEAAMMSAWTAEVSTAVAITITMDPGDDQKYLIDGTGFLALGLTYGDYIQLDGFTGDDVKFNTVFKITEKDLPTDTSLVVWGSRGLGDAAGPGTHLVQPAYVDIGQVINSFTLAKAYRDVLHTDPDYHGQSYPGSIISAMTVAATYGEIMTAAFTFMSNGYSQDNPALEQQIPTAGGSITPSGTSQQLNATLDSGLVTVGGEATEFCIESIEITLENNLTPQNCIGRIAPSKYNLGKANVGVSMSVYNTDPAYDAFMPKKWTQEPVQIGFTAVNDDGGYIFHLEAVQLSFPDPASTGENTQVMIAAEGTGKIGENGESSMRIYAVSPAMPVAVMSAPAPKKKASSKSE